MRWHARLCNAGLLALLGLIANPAMSQSLVPRALFVDDRGAELFDTEGAEGGIRAGSFDIRAAAGLSFGLDSNAYAQPNAERAQSTATGEALVRATNHSANRDILGLAYVRARRYENARDLDATEFGAVGSYDGWVGPQDRITAGFDAERTIESRTDIETPTAIPLSLYDNLHAGVAHTHVFNRVSIESRLDARTLQYDAPSEAARDRAQYRAELSGAYAVRSNMSWLITGYYNRDEFDDPSLVSPSASTVGGLLGARFDVRDLIQLEFGAGYFERRYDNTFEPLSGIAIRGSLTWHPTQLTSLRAQALRTDAPTRIAGAVGKVRNDALFEINHEYSRTLLLHAGARFIADDFSGIDRTDTAWLAELGCTWSFGRHSVLRLYMTSAPATQ